MSVAEIGQLHNRYVRLSDKFKSIWTYHQFAAGVYKNLLDHPLPYQIDFQQTFESIRALNEVVQAADVAAGVATMEKTDRELGRMIVQLVGADREITAPLLRRFFEKLKKHDDKILYYLVKFYLYSESVDGDYRDKIDFLVTRIGEDFTEEKGEYWSKDSLELRKHLQSLGSVRSAKLGGQAEIINIIRTIRGLRDEILAASSFEHLAQRNLLKGERAYKHQLGDNYFHPDVLLAIIELNVTAKNTFLKLYREEEQRILEDSRKLLEHEQAISRGFGESNPVLLGELARFREFKRRFDDSRANSNLKHDVIAQLKTSMSNILAQLDRGLDGRSFELGLEDLSQSVFLQARHSDSIADIFGNDALLNPYLLRIVTALEAVDRKLPEERIIRTSEVEPLRLEPWEVTAYQMLCQQRSGPEPESEELLQLYLRGAALRMKIDEEACALAAVHPSVPPEPGLLEQAKASLDRAKELDESFGDFLHDVIHYSSPSDLHRLYRSRFRLLRGFSGLWLIYDKYIGAG